VERSPGAEGEEAGVRVYSGFTVLSSVFYLLAQRRALMAV
jgi:hypothetical protein